MTARCPLCNSPIETSSCVILLSGGMIMRGDQARWLSKGEACIVALLLKHKGEFLPAARLINHYAATRPVARELPSPDSLRALICHMRPKLHDIGCTIEGRNGWGYRFVEGSP